MSYAGDTFKILNVSVSVVAQRVKNPTGIHEDGFDPWPHSVG